MQSREDNGENTEAFLNVKARIDMRQIDRNVLDEEIIAVLLDADVIFLVLENDFRCNQFEAVHPPEFVDVDGEMRILLKVKRVGHKPAASLSMLPELILNGPIVYTPLFGTISLNQIGLRKRVPKSHLHKLSTIIAIIQVLEEKFKKFGILRMLEIYNF